MHELGKRINTRLRDLAPGGFTQPGNQTVSDPFVWHKSAANPKQSKVSHVAVSRAGNSLSPLLLFSPTRFFATEANKMSIRAGREREAATVKVSICRIRSF